MFPTLKLFNGIPCPEQHPPRSTCHRQPCPFSHLISSSNQSCSSLQNNQSKSTTSTKLTTENQRNSLLESKKPTVSTSQDPQPFSAKDFNRNTPAKTSLDRPINPKLTAKTESTLSFQATVNGKKSTKSESRVLPSDYEPEPETLKPPRIQIPRGALLHTATAIRQKLLSTIYDDYLALYETQIGLTQPIARSLAHRDSLKEELGCFTQTVKNTYRNSIINKLVAIKKRSKKSQEDLRLLGDGDQKRSIDRKIRFLTGTMSNYEQNLKKLLELNKAHIDWFSLLEKFQNYLLTKEKMIQLDYIIEIPEVLEEDILKENSSKPEQEICARCSKTFHVSDSVLEGDEEECEFHWGKPTFEKIGGLKQRIFNCCNASMEDGFGNRGCTKGRHVYVDKTASALQAKFPFIRLPTEPPRSKSQLKLAAIDCELVYTTAGMSLARVSIVEPCPPTDDGQTVKTLMDELVVIPPSIDIIDLNTRFSGIQSVKDLRRDLSTTTRFDLKEIQEEMINLGFTRKTILCGHGLENDLKALRIVHDRCIDTADLFPHPRGLPMRMSLKKLASIFLNKLIQNSDGSDDNMGHDSIEDASIALELVLHKIQHDPITSSSNQSQTPVS